MRQAARKRPLCAACIALMFLILLAKAGDLPIFGEPPDDPLLLAAAEQEKTVQIVGTVRNRTVKARSVQYILFNSYLRSENKTIPIHTITMISTLEECFQADAVLLVTGILSKPEAASNPGQFDLRSYYESEQIYYSVYAESCKVLQSGGGIREKLIGIREMLSLRLDQLTDPETAEVLKAVLLGDRTSLTADSKRSFQTGGILHFLAISGLHISLLGQGLLKVLQKAGLPLPPAAILSFLCLAFYCVLAGAAPSAVRALCMFTVFLGAKLLLRTYDSLSALALAGILMLVENPAVLFASGFQLSFCAVLAVSLCWPAVSWLLPRQIKKPGKLSMKSGVNQEEGKELTRRGIRAWIRYYTRLFLHQACFWMVMTASMLPLTAWHYFEISIWGMLPNLLLIPAAPILLASGVAGLLAGMVSASAGKLLLLPGAWILRCFQSMGNLIRELPMATWVCGKPGGWQTCSAAAVLIFLTAELLRRKTAAKKQKGNPKKQSLQQGRRFAAAGLLLALFLLLFRFRSPWSLTMLDVGQGDCLVLRDRTACFLVDGGSSSVSQAGNYRILPYLKSQGISRLNGILLSHPDEDHMNGILELFEIIREKQATLQIDVLYLPIWMKGSEEEAELIQAAEAVGTEIIYAARGDSIRTRELEIKVLYPMTQGGIRSGNSGSMVLSVHCGTFDALLTGDLESDGEAQLLPLDQTYDYLKVGHHGSKGSSSENFLQQVQPRIAAVSAPEDSRYGHPHQETIDRLTEAGTEIYVTRDCGAITVEGRRNGWRMYGYLDTMPVK
ncbi:MAG: DNA internalization-related competence protein ComEC/Rec2 [Lachnospiraceae bacterium]|nr:DNA internalization-related competence protein ComEC/Rec2 [Lachnospiraceae bacterium]